MTLASGTKLGRYEIRSQLGAGGMGEVYLAQDTKLGRKVALKILPAEFAAHPDRMRRFVLEAKTASALNHPNIITIYEIDETDSGHFIATEFIDGETLREHEKRPLALSESLDIATQIASALAAAHAAGIVHRDIKPENVMLRHDRIVKVLDFGLAKLTDQTSPEAVDTEAPTRANIKTEPGVVMGTAVYMSPEQARGVDIDARTDIWSLGVVLYEMVAGCLPFAGSTSSEVLASILGDKETQPLARYSREVPAELERIVSKALRKDREARYQNVKDLLIDLRDLKQKLELDARLERSLQPDSRSGVSGASVRRQAALETAQAEAAPTGEGAVIPTISSAGILLGEIKRHQLGVALTLAALVIAAVAAFFYFHRQPALTDKDTILLDDWVNTTGDTVFDGTLKQALAVQLEQSPFLNIFPEERVRETLRLMSRSPDEHVTNAIGREICQRQGIKVLLTGSIASLGRSYVITLEAINSQSAEVIARQQVEAESKEQVIKKLGEATTKLREKLGESLSSIQKFDAPLEQATTSSLEALKVFSLGFEQNVKGKPLEAISSLKHAIELDPNFAWAYSALASAYNNSGQSQLAAEAAQKAFELRERVSEREKFYIASHYYFIATGEVNKSIEALELYKQTYPRDYVARNLLGTRYNSIGQYERAIEELHESIRLNPNSVNPYSNLVGAFMRLNRFEEAKAVGEQALAQKLESVGIHSGLYYIAFIQGDTAAMKQQVDWAGGRPGEYAHLNWQAGGASFAGQWQKAQELSNRAAELAEQRKLAEVAGEIVSSNAALASVLGQCGQSRADLARAAALPRTPISFFRAGIVMALCGDAAQAQALNDEAVKRYPKDTWVNEIYLPLIRAAIQLQRGNISQAIQMLQAVSRYESVTFFYSNYLRGQAYLGERKGAEAASEFQKILDHRGWSPLSPLYPLAHLGLARAAVLQGDSAKARKAYQDFFALWKDADADLPILMEAKREYEKIK